MIVVSSMSGKAKLVKRQRFRIVSDSIFGFWSDSSHMMDFKISPTGPCARIKITSVNDINVLERISFFCGLQFIPKRAKWKGFDFVTQLVKEDKSSYKDGLVHMPNARRKNLANLTVLDSSKILLNFYFVKPKQEEEVKNYVGSLTLIKKMPG